jgi:hypothetical protein
MLTVLSAEYLQPPFYNFFIHQRGIVDSSLAQGDHNVTESGGEACWL